MSSDLCDIPLCWLVNGDPYNGVLLSLYYPYKTGDCIIPCRTKPTGVSSNENHGNFAMRSPIRPHNVSITRGISTFRTTASRVAIKAKVGLQPLPATRCGFKVDLSHTFALVILFYYIHISGPPENISRLADLTLTFREKYTYMISAKLVIFIGKSSALFLHIQLKQVKFKSFCELATNTNCKLFACEIIRSPFVVGG